MMRRAFTMLAFSSMHSPGMQAFRGMTKLMGPQLGWCFGCHDCEGRDLAGHTLVGSPA